MNSLHCSPVITGTGPLGILIIVPGALAARFSGIVCFVLKTLVGKLRISLTMQPLSFLQLPHSLAAALF